MKITNISNFPEALVKAITNDPYTKGDSEFSVTELISPPRISALRAAYKDDIQEDASDRLYSLYGQIAHLILERANVNSIAEKRYFGTIGGARVSAQVDTLDLQGGVLSDWKFTTSYKFKAGNPTPSEWEMQLNFQLELLRQNGLSAKYLQIVGLLRDFSKLEAKRDLNYPQKAVAIMPIEVWPREACVKKFEERVILHRQARISLPLCTAEDQWRKAPVYAVMKNGQVRAKKLYSSESEAALHAVTDKDLSVETRPGELTRCENYCPVSKFCTQFQEETKDERTTDSGPIARPVGSLR